MNQQEKRLLNKNTALKKEVAIKNRELQIEASLERVRKVAMGMQKSEQLAEAAKVFFEQFNLLGEMPDRMSIGIFNEKSRKVELWVTDQSGNQVNNEYFFSINEPTSISKIYKAWKKKKDTFIVDLTGKNLKDWVKFVKEEAKLPIDEKKIKGRRVQQAAFFSRGFLLFTTHKPVGDEIMKLLVRFARVFNLTYTRFLDLQKAEEQVREAQIQLALERVRARTMAMQKSDELQEIVTIVFNRLTDLDIRIDSASVIVLSDTKDVMQFWVAVPGERYSTYFMIPAFANTAVAKDFIKAKESGTNFTKSYTGKEKNEQWNYLFEHSDLKHIPEDQKKMLLQAEAYTVSVSFTKNTALQLLRYNEGIFSENENEIFQRFASVFEQAYIRFLDLQKAEAQAREAQIQLALERVRARTMAMQKSEELADVATILFQQVKALGVPQWACGFCIWDIGDTECMWYSGSPVGEILPPVRFPLTEHPVFRIMDESRKRGDKLYILEKEGELQADHYRYMMTLPGVRELLQGMLDAGLTIPSFQIDHYANFAYGNLIFITYEHFPEMHDIFIRFANVFEQTYTRFLDLQKAEAQAREAQIETALEKVRSRTVGMQKSEELKEVIQLVYEQFVQLKINVEHTGFLIDYKARDDMHIWLADQHMAPSEVTIPYFDSPPNNSIKEAKEKGQDFFTYHLTFEEKNKFYKDLFKVIPDVPEETLEYYFNCPGLAGSGVLLENIGLYIENFSGTLYSNEENAVLMRFGKVFQQTYTRFLDLEKAEAQTREAQIELGLERVRARTMAMQNSDELGELVTILFDELTKLDLILARCIIWIFNNDTLEAKLWMANSEDKRMANSYFIKRIHHPYYDAILTAWKKRKTRWVYDLKGDEKKTIDQVLLNETELSQLPEAVKNGILISSETFVAGSFNNFGLIEASGPAQPTPEQLDILTRFGKVFDLSYTRFNDLKQAESQTREAQIQLALERARAQSMMMQHSTELDDTLRVFHEQILQLGISSAFSFLWLPDEEKDRHIFWAAWAENNLFKTKAINYPLDRSEPATAQCLVDWKSNEPVVSYNVPPDGVKNYFAAWSELIDGVEQLRPEYFSDGLYYVEAFMKYGCFGVMVRNDLKEDERKMLVRFAIEFERAYTRFLDLQKAEAQAREANIEAGLERVRSRAMAMQNSEELAALIGTVFTELTRLDLVLTRCVIWIFDRETNGATWWMANSEDPQNPINCDLPYNAYEPYLAFLEQWKKSAIKFQYELSGTIKKDWDDYLFSETGLSRLPAVVIEGMKAPGRVLLTASFNNFGAVNAATLEPLSDEHVDILLRFAKVFDLTYTRFNDLKQAEAQVREAQIEAALEKVRSRSLAMHKSEELQEVVHTVLGRLKDLNIEFYTAIIILFEKDSKDIIWWLENKEKQQYSRILVPYANIPYLRDLFNAKKNGINQFSKSYSSKEKDELYHHLFEHTDFKHVPEKQKQFLLQAESATMSVSIAKNSGIHLTRYSKKAFSEDDNEILGRFANVFEQSYTRFLDLQKAESQAREAQIEAALEKVRSRSLAMHHSEELSEVVNLLFDRMAQLGVVFDAININIVKPEERSFDSWMAAPGEHGSMSLHVSYFDNPVARDLFDAFESGTGFFSKIYSREEKNAYFNQLFEFTDFKRLPAERKQMILNAEQWCLAIAIANNTVLSLHSYSGHRFAETDFEILKRFSKVFNQAYTRFLDLQKAEAQAREAQIEASLERVRSKTMAMHNSADVGETVAALFDELKKLGIETIRCGIGIMQNTKSMEVWTAKPNENNKIDLIIGHLDMNLHPLLQGAFKGWSNKKESFSYELKQDDLINYFTAINNHSAYPVQYNIATLPSTIYHNDFFFSEGTLFAFSVTQLSEENKKICRRFAAVFGQTYRRYLDLKKAEAAAREAQIEAALERVRGRAMAMHSSEDLAETIHVFYHEIELLSVTPRRCGVGLLNKESRVCKLSTMTTTEEGEPVEVIGKLDLQGHPVLDGIYNNWLNQKEYHPVLRGNEIKEYYKLIRPQISYPDYPNDMAQYGYFFFFPEGGAFAWTEKKLPEAELQIYRRFTSVLSLTYKRFHELQQAEANAKEALKQSALDRIRADIASMRTVSDLERITPLIWTELTILGVPFIRCGVFIMDESNELIHTFLSTPDGAAIAAFHIPYTTPGNIEKVLSHWQHKKSYIDHWDEKAFIEFAEALVEQKVLASPEQYLRSIPHDGFYLHFAPFLQGMLYVGNISELSEEEINLIQSVADAFSTAYARYEDFNKLEATKQQVEKTLTDLKQAQQQLIQSEKMASLGELTAGIAHEIQNPLNFVNNFSEVNKEMLQELKGERLKPKEERNDTLENELINDVIANEEKINHHGKRADAIVKGMLQHSRTSAGQKELTDINVLADEYLRLSYHGIRAKDKSFNAEMKTIFDDTIGKINVVPQDIGRVLLNLFNNAFYAVNEKKKTADENYKPEVSIQTKKIDNTVELTVKDNGNGVPASIKDKIFQPFFTTKPTGGGTGLGLSLSYDIIKAHGGEIKVETKEGLESKFIIDLSLKG